MKKVTAGIISGYGINAGEELGAAFNKAGAEVEFIHIHDLLENPAILLGYSILGFPGGFSFGDHLGSGKVLSHLLKKNLGESLNQYLADPNHLVLGICNGFQTIVKMGLVPDLNGNYEQQASLINNESGNFIDKWVQLRCNESNKSPWLSGISDMKVPIRHGEGCFMVENDQIGDELLRQNLVAFYYEGENPNGAWLGIAGITNTTGRILGMMPHPEAYNQPDQDPGFKRGVSVENWTTDGMRLFSNAVAYCRLEH